MSSASAHLDVPHSLLAVCSPLVAVSVVGQLQIDSCLRIWIFFSFGGAGVWTPIVRLAGEAFYHCWVFRRLSAKRASYVHAPKGMPEMLLPMQLWHQMSTGLGNPGLLPACALWLCFMLSREQLHSHWHIFPFAVLIMSYHSAYGKDYFFFHIKTFNFPLFFGAVTLSVSYPWDTIPVPKN